MESELIFNLWAIYDSGAGVVYGLAGRAYAVTGTDREKLDFLKSISGTDYVTAKRYRVPDRFSINFSDGDTHRGVTYLSAVHDPSAQLFEEMFKNIENDLPPIPSFSDGGHAAVKQAVPQDPLCVVTVLFEDELGNIRPIITDEDREWIKQHHAKFHQGLGI